jgi:ATP-dependent helicase HrpB
MPPSLPLPTTDLPVEGCISAIRDALGDVGHAVLHAPPGAGKTTIVPLRLLDEPWLDGHRIVVLEPRRLAARAAAHRMADLLHEAVGATVGYRTRDETRVARGTRVEVVTDGILTRRLQRDPSLPGIGLVVFDEIHERNLQTDLALALTLDARAVLRPALRILAMSATVDTTRVATLLGGDGPPAPIVASDGRAHPVEIHWQPLDPRERPAEATARVVVDAVRTDDGDALVFLPGAADIRNVGSILQRSLPEAVDVRPLFGALSLAEQDQALAPSPPGRRRVVLATDIAETSLTVAGVRIVIDQGQVRSPRYDARSGLTRLHTGPISRASADQRAGRAGRTGPGVAYRLWSRAEHGHRRPFAPAEIEAVDLAALALELALWGTAVAGLGFLDPPPARALADARVLLGELEAIDVEGRVTPQGRAMAELPVHPRLARMIVAAERRGLTAIACALAALIEERDVLRGRPDELPAGVDDRVRLVLDRRRTHAFADRASLQLVRRRTTELRRRVTGRHAAPTDDDPTEADLAACGSVLAVAYPDRLAQSRGDGRYRLRSGTMAVLPEGDALVGDPFLVVADLDAPRGNAGPRPARGPGRPLAGDDDLRIRLAAGLDEADLERAARGAIEEIDALAWDEDRDDLRVRHERRLGSITLATHEARAGAGPATTAALVDRARVTRLGVLRWREADRELQARIGFAHRAFGPDWPDVTDDALLAAIDDWLTPRLNRATGRGDLERIDLGQVLRDLVGHHRIRELDALVPVRIEVASGRAVPIDYTGETPAIAVRVQDVFGTTVHPAVAQGRIPLVVHLLSPARRPIQVTADLPGFWAGSWREVRKDMAGRYPRHDWPLDPAHASPPPPRRRGPRSAGN